MSNDLADITLHIDQELSSEDMKRLKQAFYQRDGIESVQSNEEKMHLLILKYDPKLINSRDIVDIPRFLGMDAELVGI